MTKKEKEILFNEYCRIEQLLQMCCIKYSMFLSQFDDGHEPNDDECERMDEFGMMCNDWKLKRHELIRIIELLGCDYDMFTNEYKKKYMGGCTCE